MIELTVKQSVALTDLSTAINNDRQFTPGIYVCLLVPVALEDGTRFVPGLVAMVNHGRLKQCEVRTVATPRGATGCPSTRAESHLPRIGGPSR